MTVHQVDPARLLHGAWCHHAQKTLGEGDIAASYSADRIGMGKPLRAPFNWQGALWVCVSMTRDQAQAYRLVHPQAFAGMPVSYHAKTIDGDAARNDPNGFYHGMEVKHAGRSYVLTGPPAVFVPGAPQQMELF